MPRLFYMFSPWLDFADFPFRMPHAFRIVGVAFFVFAIWLLHRSHADLGGQWSPTVSFKTGHALVTEGVYKRVRHPMYAAHVPWGIAQALLLRNLIAGPLAMRLGVAFMVLRILREDLAMIDEFGDAYRRYMKTTGRLLPRFAPRERLA